MKLGLPGWRAREVVYSRKAHWRSARHASVQTAISNKERALLVSDKADICVRIHANGSDDSSVSGALTMSVSSSNPYVGHMAAENQRLSKIILDHYCRATGFNNKGVMLMDNMTGLNWSTIPNTILEMGFMTNRNDDTLMQDPGMQKKMVKGTPIREFSYPAAVSHSIAM